MGLHFNSGPRWSEDSFNRINVDSARDNERKNRGRGKERNTNSFFKWAKNKKDEKELKNEACNVFTTL